jgi:hypothetical protein
MKPTELMLRFWRHQSARGDKRTPVWAVIAGEGADQPEGYCAGWSVNRKAAEREAAKHEPPYTVVRVNPPTDIKFRSTS